MCDWFHYCFSGSVPQAVHTVMFLLILGYSWLNLLFINNTQYNISSLYNKIQLQLYIGEL